METNGIPYDANQFVATGVDDSTGIEALRGAWSRRVDGFRALYLEHGEISNDTDAKVALELSASLRAPITAAVVGHFRREIGLRRFERRSRPEPLDPVKGDPAAELPFEQRAMLSLSDESYIAAAVLNGLFLARPQTEDLEYIPKVASYAASVAIATVRALNEARS